MKKLFIAFVTIVALCMSGCTGKDALSGTNWKTDTGGSNYSLPFLTEQDVVMSQLDVESSFSGTYTYRDGKGVISYFMEGEDYSDEFTVNGTVLLYLDRTYFLVE